MEFVSRPKVDGINIKERTCGMLLSMEKIVKKFGWEEAPDIKARALRLVKVLKIDTIRFERLYFYRSQGSKSRAYARTWGLPKIWQDALGVKPAYIIEVMSRYFDKQDKRFQDKVLLHELSHIPKNFSGALIPHTRRKKGNFHDKLDELVERYFKNFK